MRGSVTAGSGASRWKIRFGDVGEQVVAVGEVVRGGACGQGGPGVDGAEGEAACALVGQYLDGRVGQGRASLRVAYQRGSSRKINTHNHYM
ncbi:hypothetical protein ABH917_001438 [Thermobifida halotolerans]